MKISINWLKDFVDLSGISNEEIIKRFTLSTAEIEDVYNMGENTTGVVFAKVLKVENHPNSNHLHILQVDKGGEVVQVVCGAPNVREGMTTVFAPVGSKINGQKFSKAKLAGVESFGMCCSENDLGIGSDNNGIIDINENIAPGTDVKTYYPIDDTVFEIDNKSLTNRPDLWGHYGIARELACIFNRKLKPLASVNLQDYKKLKALDVKNENKDCFRYTAIAVDNVTKSVSPAEMKIRLNYVGMRDINLLTDIANYIMMELGQPMHTFDYSVVKGIRVINAKKGTVLKTLEGEDHEIPENSCVIANENYEPVAIAGIKGGLLSGINEKTNSLLLESATFDCASIRKTSTIVGLKTDSSLRYEKSLDPELCKIASARYLHLLSQIDSGVKVVSSFTDCYNYTYPQVAINISKQFIEKRIGVEISKAEIEKIFTGLEFKFKEHNGNYDLIIPSFRATKDISLKEDIVEEVARMYGYDRIVEKSCEFPLHPVTQSKEHIMEYEIKKLLAEKFDVSEVHSYIWNYESFNKEYGIQTNSLVGLMDSSNSGQTGLRSEMLPTLIKFMSENKNSYSNIRIAEIGRVAAAINNNAVKEEKHLAILLASDEKHEKDLYFEMKEILETICNVLEVGVNYNTELSTLSYMHPVNSCVIEGNGNKVGYMGLISPSVVIDKRLNIALLELDFSELCALPCNHKVIKEVSKYQDVNIDLNFLIDKNMAYAQLESIIKSYKTKLDMSYSLKDIYESDKLNGKKSMTFTFNISSLNKTLSSEDIDKFTNKLIEHMANNNIILRG